MRAFMQALAVSLFCVLSAVSAQAENKSLTVGRILQDTYGPSFNPANPVTMVNGVAERVRVWTFYQGQWNGNPIAIVFTEGAVLQLGWNGKLDLSGSTMNVPADVSAVWYEAKNGQWQFKGRAVSLFRGGQYGQIDQGGASSPMAKPVVTPSGLIFHAQYSSGNHGTFQTFMPVMTFDQNGVRFNGSVPMGAQDQSTGSDFSGQLLSMGSDQNGLATVQVSYSGQGHVNSHGPVTNFKRLTCRYAQSSKSATLTVDHGECENLVSGAGF